MGASLVDDATLLAHAARLLCLVAIATPSTMILPSEGMATRTLPFLPASYRK